MFNTLEIHGQRISNLQNKTKEIRNLYQVEENYISVPFWSLTMAFLCGMIPSGTISKKFIDTYIFKLLSSNRKLLVSDTQIACQQNSSSYKPLKSIPPFLLLIDKEIHAL